MAEHEPVEPLSKSLSQLLDAERVLKPVPAAAKARMLGKISSTLFDPGGGGGGGGGHAAPHGPASPAASSAGTWGTAAVTKLAVGVAVVSFAVGGAVGVGAHTVMQGPPAPAPSPVARITPPEPPPSVVRTPPPAVPEPAPAPIPPPPVVAKPPAAHPDALGQERSLVDQSRSALARKDFASALSAVEEHERRFANGQLAEERSALKVVALSGAGRDVDAHAAAAAFRARWPESLLMPLVDSAGAP